MKPWLSPVLLAVGWYLLMPPFVGGKPDIEAPLSRWDQAATFTSLSDCSDEREPFRRWCESLLLDLCPFLDEIV
jgi:hypothetical protein